MVSTSMPYADPEKQKAAMREVMRRRRLNKEIRERENAERAARLKENPEGNLAAVNKWNAANPDLLAERRTIANAKYRLKIKLKAMGYEV